MSSSCAFMIATDPFITEVPSYIYADIKSGRVPLYFRLRIKSIFATFYCFYSWFISGFTRLHFVSNCSDAAAIYRLSATAPRAHYVEGRYTKVSLLLLLLLLFHSASFFFL